MQPKAMTLRLTAEQADLLDVVAAVEGRTVSDVVRDAIARHIDTVSKSDAFQDALRAQIERAQGLLQR